MGLGFKLPGSPHLSPSLRPHSNHSSQNSGSGSLSSQAFGGSGSSSRDGSNSATHSPSHSPYLLPKSSSGLRLSSNLKLSASKSKLRSSMVSSDGDSSATAHSGSGSGLGPGSVGASSSSSSSASSSSSSSSSAHSHLHTPTFAPTSSTSSSSSSTNSPHMSRSNHPKPKPAVEMEFRIESPPLLMIGPQSESTGSLLSGLFTLNVNAPSGVALKSVHIAIVQDVCLNVPNSPATINTHNNHGNTSGNGSGFLHHHKIGHSHLSNTNSSHPTNSPLPFSYSTNLNPNSTSIPTSSYAPAAPVTAWPDPPHFHHLLPAPCLTCADCLTRSTELARWNVLASPNVLPKGPHAYPFSHLIPGSVPASCYNPLFTVRYRLVAVAVPDPHSGYFSVSGSVPGSAPGTPLLMSLPGSAAGTPMGSPVLGPVSGHGSGSGTSTPTKNSSSSTKSPSSFLAKSPLLGPKSGSSKNGSSSAKAPSMIQLPPSHFSLGSPSLHSTSHNHHNNHHNNSHSTNHSSSNTAPSTPGLLPLSPEPYVHELALEVKRAVVHGPDRNSIRVFPPTELVAHLSMPNIAYPESTFLIELVLEGVSLRPENATRQTRWRMRKTNWRIDEACKYVVKRCDAHIYDKIPRKGRALASATGSSEDRGPGTQAAAINNGGFTNAGGTTTGSIGPTLEPPSDHVSVSENTGLSSGTSSTSHVPEALPPVILPPPAAVTISRSPYLSHSSGSRPGSSVNLTRLGGSSSSSNSSHNTLAAPSPLHLPQTTQHAPHSPIQSPRIAPLSTFAALGNLQPEEPEPAVENHAGGSNERNNENENNGNNSNSSSNQPTTNDENDGGNGPETRTGSQAGQNGTEDPTEGEQQGPHPGNRPGDVTFEHTRIVGMGEIKSDFKTDFSGKGKVELMAEIDTHTLNHVSCNLVDSEFGMSISHTLVLEMVVAEELVPAKGHYQPVATGAARVLRMQFGLNVTQRPGLGIAWDDEVPPIYADVPTSPPQYESVKGQTDLFNHIAHSNIDELRLVPEEGEYFGGIHARLETNGGPGSSNGHSVGYGGIHGGHGSGYVTPGGSRSVGLHGHRLVVSSGAQTPIAQTPLSGPTIPNSKVGILHLNESLRALTVSHGQASSPLLSSTSTSGPGPSTSVPASPAPAPTTASAQVSTSESAPAPSSTSASASISSVPTSLAPMSSSSTSTSASTSASASTSNNPFLNHDSLTNSSTNLASNNPFINMPARPTASSANVSLNHSANPSANPSTNPSTNVSANPSANPSRSVSRQASAVGLSNLNLNMSSGTNNGA